MNLMEYYMNNKRNVTKERTTSTTISISYANYRHLKRLGDVGDSFNDVLTNILREIKILKPDSEGASLTQTSRNNVSTTGVYDIG